jgi:hypothetical protein
MARPRSRDNCSGKPPEKDIVKPATVSVVAGFSSFSFGARPYPLFSTKCQPRGQTQKLKQEHDFWPSGGGPVIDARGSHNQLCSIQSR